MQVAAACLYHLTKFDLSLRIHPDIISKVLKVTLYALEKFPNDISIQKNFLLILYNDRVLRVCISLLFHYEIYSGYIVKR